MTLRHENKVITSIVYDCQNDDFTITIEEGTRIGRYTFTSLTLQGVGFINPKALIEKLP
jgi:hypothetical protein